MNAALTGQISLKALVGFATNRDLSDFCQRAIERYAVCWVLCIVKNRHSHALVKRARRIVALARDKFSTSESKTVLDGLGVSSIILSGYIARC